MKHLMMVNPLLGMWLGGMHAWMRTLNFWSGAWMYESRDAQPQPVPAAVVVPLRRAASGRR